MKNDRMPKWVRFYTDDIPGISSNEEIAVNMDQVVLWKGRGAKTDSWPELFLSNGMHIRVKGSHFSLNKITGLEDLPEPDR